MVSRTRRLRSLVLRFDFVRIDPAPLADLGFGSAERHCGNGDCRLPPRAFRPGGSRHLHGCREHYRALLCFYLRDVDAAAHLEWTDYQIPGVDGEIASFPRGRTPS